MSVNDYFDEVLCINLKRRRDRWEHVEDQCKRHALTVKKFVGLDYLNWGNMGCTMSHRLVLEHIMANRIPRTLVLEDDFKCVHDDCQKRFSDMIGLVPADWDFIYLGGHYADDPKYRVNQHVIRMNRMKTTSSYGITLAQAERMCSYIRGNGPIDELFSDWTEKSMAYIFQPRLIVQAASVSDLQGYMVNYEPCMLDSHHENLV